MAEDNTTNVAAPEDPGPATENNSTNSAPTTASVAANTGASPQSTATAVASQREDDEEDVKPSGEDFGSLLDKFEQEQSALQEGEVVRGTVVGITERGVVIDFGYKSESSRVHGKRRDYRQAWRRS